MRSLRLRDRPFSQLALVGMLVVSLLSAHAQESTVVAGPSDLSRHAMVANGPLLGNQGMLLDSPFCEAHACELVGERSVVRQDALLLVERSYVLAGAPGVRLDVVLQPAIDQDPMLADSSLRVMTIDVRIPALRASLTEVIGSFAEDLVTQAFGAVVAFDLLERCREDALERVNETFALAMFTVGGGAAWCSWSHVSIGLEPPMALEQPQVLVQLGGVR